MNISHKIFLCQARRILPYIGSDCIEIFDVDIESYIKVNLYDHHTQDTFCINYHNSCYIGYIGIKNKSHYGMILFKMEIFMMYIGIIVKNGHTKYT